MKLLMLSVFMLSTNAFAADLSCKLLDPKTGNPTSKQLNVDWGETTTKYVPRSVQEVRVTAAVVELYSPDSGTTSWSTSFKHSSQVTRCGEFIDRSSNHVNGQILFKKVNFGGCGHEGKHNSIVIGQETFLLNCQGEMP